MGAKVVGISEQSHSIQGLKKPIFEDKYVMNNEEWDRLISGVNKLGKVAKDMGITLTFHHHLGTVVQTPEEIDRLMQNTDPEYFNLLFDSGHLAFMGYDYAAVLEKYIDRVKHVHLKDIRPDVIRKVKENHLSFLEGVRLGQFTVPGDGTLDFDPIFKLLEEHNYEGWIIVEAEQDPAVANPFEYALKSRKFIREKTGILRRRRFRSGVVSVILNGRQGFNRDRSHDGKAQQCQTCDGYSRQNGNAVSYFRRSYRRTDRFDSQSRRKSV